MSIIKERLPLEFKEKMKELLGDEYDSFIDSYDEERTNGLRINNLKISQSYFEKLNLFSIDESKDKVQWSDISYYLSSDESPGKNPLHDAGAYYIQEPSAMSVVGKTNISKNEKILDICAAPGGKSTYILSKLENTGLLVSNEINPQRVKALGDNLEKFGAINSIITNTDSSSLLTFFKGFFDKVFIDAPCSGQGMFRKDEYAIDDWSEDKVKECVSIQKQLLEDGFDMLVDHGTLIYSTCTFSKEENEDMINDFLKLHNDAVLVEMERIWPHKERGEGHFCARIKKDLSKDIISMNRDYFRDIEDESPFKSKKCMDKKKSKSKSKSGNKGAFDKELVYYNEFFKGCIRPDSRFVELTKDLEFLKKDNLLYLVPKVFSKLKGLKVMRAGLFLGELKKNRFEPSHSLAMALCRDDVYSYVNFSYDGESIKKYIYGETIDLNNLDVEMEISSLEGLNLYSDYMKDFGNRGWTLVLVEGVSIGWAKEASNTLKNKYPKGLRRRIK